MFLPSLADGTAVADAFVLPASAVQRLTSRPVEDVHLLRDEAANLAWAGGAVMERAGRRGAARRTGAAGARRRRPPARCGTARACLPMIRVVGGDDRRHDAFWWMRMSSGQWSSR